MCRAPVIPDGKPETGIQHFPHGPAKVKPIDIGTSFQVCF